jgi:hypothetical protein
VGEPNDELGHAVGRRRLAGEQHGARHHVGEVAPANALEQPRHVQQVEVLSLVLVDALDLHVEHGRGVDVAPVHLREPLGERHLVVVLHRAETLDEPGVARERAQPLEPIELAQPPVAHGLGDQPREARVRHRHEPALRDPVRHVGELLGPQLGEIAQHRLAQQPRVQLGHAVHGVARHRGEVRHAHASLPRLVDDRHAAHALFVAGEALAHQLEEARVDLEDELEVPRQEAREERQRPRLERLGQERVVRVRERLGGDGPRVVPAEAVHVEQEAHQLGHSQRGVRVVELHGELVGELVDGRALQQQPDAVLQRARHEEVLLLEAQLATSLGVVARIEHLGDVLAADLGLDGAPVVALLKGAEVELLGRDGRPQAQEVGVVGAVAEHGRVVGHALHHPRRQPPHDVPARHVDRVLGAAPVAHHRLELEAPDFPRVSEAEPQIGHLDLRAVSDLLIEDAELVADAVPDRRQVERGERVHEAGRQAPEAAVTETRLLFLLDQLVELEPQLGERVAHRPLDAEAQQVGRELRPHQVLGRQVDHRAVLALEVGAGRAHPAQQDAVAHGVCERQVVVVARRHAGKLRELEIELSHEVSMGAQLRLPQ